MKTPTKSPKSRSGTKRARPKAPPVSSGPAPTVRQDPECINCGTPYDPRRKALGYDTCLDCGSPRKQFTVAPGYNKGGLQLITNPADLKTIHKKGDSD